MHMVMLWACRVFVWTLLGPWMKLVDVFYIHPYYRTKEELLADPTVKDTHLESVLTSNSLKEMGKSARLASEEALKVRCDSVIYNKIRNGFCLIFCLAQGHARTAIWQIKPVSAASGHVETPLHSSPRLYGSTVRREWLCRRPTRKSTMGASPRPTHELCHDPKSKRVP